MTRVRMTMIFTLLVGVAFCAPRAKVTPATPVQKMPVQSTSVAVSTKFVTVLPASGNQPAVILILPTVPGDTSVCAPAIPPGGILSCRSVTETLAWLRQK